MRDRSWRRAQRRRAIADARRRAALNGIGAEWREGWVVRSAVTPHPCSRFCCGNPRRHGHGDKPGKAPAPLSDWG